MLIKDHFKSEHRLHIAAAIAAASTLLWLFWALFVPTATIQQAERPLVIKPGDGLSAIARQLDREHIVHNARIFQVYVTFRGWGRNLKAGEYLIPQGAPLYEVARALASGNAVNDIEVTIPEGYDIWEIDRRLTEAGFATGTDFARAYNLADGMFFPDTYRFKKGSTIIDIAARMRDNFDVKTSEIFKDLNIQKQNEIIITASILEKEARSEADMRLVSGIIENRLAGGMPLEIDATVSYGACVRQYTKSLTKDCRVQLIAVGEEIKNDGPFNTYIRPGLPPRPISNPGLKAIQAALRPAKTDYLYYLSTRDGSQIIYSKTAAEHIANRRRYLGL